MVITKPILAIRIGPESLFQVPLLKYTTKKSFVAGEPFKFRVKVINIGDAPFPGGKLIVNIEWRNGLIV